MEVRTVEIEFLEDTYGPDGDVRRNQGDHLLVDKMSAHSLCDVKKVARRVTDAPVPSTSKRVPRKKTDEEPAEGELRTDRC